MITINRCGWATISWLTLACSLHTVRAQTIFRDDFSDGSATDGLPVTWAPEPLAPGSYDALTGDYVLSDGALMISTVPEHDLGDASMRARARLVGEGISDNFVGLGARRGSWFGYAAALGRTGAIDIIRIDSQFDARRIAAGNVDFNPVDQDVMLQLDAFGDELRFWVWEAGQPMPSEPQLTAQDSGYATGFAGVATLVPPGGGQSVYRFVHVADSHIPEPSTAALAALAVVGLAAVRRRWMRSTRASG